MSETLYAGLTGLSLDNEVYDLGHGVILRREYAHLFSPWMMAFEPATKGGPHPAPWRAVEGGSAFDINVEVEVSNLYSEMWTTLDAKLETMIMLLRLTCAPAIAVPVKLRVPIKSAATQSDAFIERFETETLALVPPSKGVTMHPEDLEWFKQNWLTLAKLLKENPVLQAALEVCDDCRIQRHTSYSMLAIWGALEHLFSPARSELRHRVASNIATFLEPRGEKRVDSYRRVLKLYDQRSVAAHTATNKPPEYFLESWVLLRNVLMKILVEGKIPTQLDFEQALFGS